MIEVRGLGGSEARRRISELAGILQDCVNNGASVSFMNPFDFTEAVEFFEQVV